MNYNLGGYGSSGGTYKITGVSPYFGYNTINGNQVDNKTIDIETYSNTESLYNYGFFNDTVVYSGENNNRIYLSTEFDDTVVIDSGSTNNTVTLYRSSATVSSTDNSIDVELYSTLTLEGGGGNAVTIERVLSGSGQTIDDFSSASNTISVGSGYTANLYTAVVGDTINMSGGNGSDFTTLNLSGFGGNTVNVDGYSDVAINDTTVYGYGVNNVHVGSYAIATIDTSSRGAERIYVSGGGYYANTTVNISGAGGNEIDVEGYAHAGIDDTSSTPDTIKIVGNASETRVSGTAADGIYVYGTNNYIGASGDFIRLYAGTNGVYGTGNNIQVDNSGTILQIIGAGGNSIGVYDGTGTVDDYSTASNTVGVAFGYTANLYTQNVGDTVNMFGGGEGSTKLNLSGYGTDTVKVGDGIGYVPDEGIFFNYANISDTSSFQSTIVVGSYDKVTVTVDAPHSDTIVVSGDYSSVDASGDIVELNTGTSDNDVSGNYNTIATVGSSNIYAYNTSDFKINTGGTYYNYISGSNDTIAILGYGSNTNVYAAGLEIDVYASNATVNLFGTVEDGAGGNTITVEGGATATIGDRTVYGYSYNTINVGGGGTANIFTQNYIFDTINVSGGAYGDHSTVNLSGAGDNEILIGGDSFASVNDTSANANFIGIMGNYARVYMGGTESTADIIIVDGSSNYIRASGDSIELNPYTGNNSVYGTGNTITVEPGGYWYNKTGLNLGGAGGNTVNVDSGSYFQIYDYSSAPNTINVGGNNSYVYMTGDRSPADTIAVYGTYDYVASNYNNVALTGFAYKNTVYGSGNTVTIGAAADSNTVNGNFNTIAVYSDATVYANSDFMKVLTDVNYNYVNGVDNSLAIDGVDTTNTVTSSGLYIQINGYNDVVNLDVSNGLIIPAGNTIAIDNGGTDTINDFVSYGYGYNTINVGNGSTADIYNYYRIGDVINISGGDSEQKSGVSLSGWGGDKIYVESGAYASVYQGPYMGLGYQGNTITVNGDDSVLYVSGFYSGIDTIGLSGAYNAVLTSGSDIALGAGADGDFVLGDNNAISIDANSDIFGNGISGSIKIDNGGAYASYVDGSGNRIVLDGADTTTHFYGQDTNISVIGADLAATLYIEGWTYNGGNVITFDTDTFPVVQPNYAHDSFFDFTGGNTVNVTGASAVQIYASNDQIYLGEASGVRFVYGSGGNNVDIYDGTANYVFDLSDGTANTIHVGDTSTLNFEANTDRGDSIYVSGGTYSYKTTVNFVYNLANPYGNSGGNTVVISSGAYAYVYQGVNAGSTIVDSGTGTSLYMGGEYSAYDTIVLSGQGDFISAVGDYIELAGTAQSGRIDGEGNTIATTGNTIIYSYHGEFNSVNTSGIYDDGVFSTNVSVEGPYNNIVIDGAGSTNLVYAEGGSFTVGAAATVDLFGFSETFDEILYSGSGSNTITVDNRDGYAATINDYTSFNTINVVNESGAYVYTYGQGDTLSISGGSWAELSGYGGNTVSINDGAAKPNSFYDDSSAANTVDIYGSGDVFNLTKNGDTINVYGELSLFGAGGDTVLISGFYTGEIYRDGYANIYQASRAGNTIFVGGDDSSLYLTGRGAANDTVIVNGEDDTIHANGAYIEVTYNAYHTDIAGSGNTIALSIHDSRTYLYGGNIYVTAEEGLYAEAYGIGNQKLYASGNALTLLESGRVVDLNVAGLSSVVNVTNESNVTLYNANVQGDTVGLGGYSTLYMQGAGGNTVTVSDGTFNWLYDESAGSNTINVVSGGIYGQLYNDAVSLKSDFDESTIHGDGNLISLGDDASLQLYGEGGNTVTVGNENYGRFYDDTRPSDGGNYSNTVNISDADARVYTENNGDTINLNTDSNLDLYGYGANTVVVSGRDNFISDGSYAPSTVFLKGDAGVYLYGRESASDTIVVSGYSNYINGGHYIEMNGNAGLTVYNAYNGINTIAVTGYSNILYSGGQYIEMNGGDAGLYLSGGENTIAVNGTGNYIYDSSSVTSAIVLSDGAGLEINAQHDTITAATGASGNVVTLDSGGSEDLVTLNANSGSTVKVGSSSATEFINASTGTIDITASNTTVYIWDSGFVAGDSSDTLDVTGTGDTVKFVNAMITAAAAFGTPSSPASLVVEDAYVGATAINAVSHH